MSLAVCGLLATAWLHSQAGVVRGDDLPTDDSSAQADGILIMRTGAVVSGRIARSGNLYEITGPYGKMQVPAELVKLRCDDLQEAYTKLHETAKSHHSANARITLARWCLTHHLDDEARQELQEALLLEPDREDAKRLLRDAEDAIKSRQKKVPAAEPASAIRVSRKASATDDDPVTLAGLSREQALQFTRRVQPLLVNSCAAAGCHSRNSQTGFRLQNVSPGRNANRNATERNLAQILEYVDVKRPSTSLLLTNPRRRHGRNGRPVFVGQRGDEQFAELEKWVIAVARDENQRSERDSSRKNSAQRAAATQKEAGTTATADSAAATGSRFSDAAPFAHTRADATSSQLPLPPASGDPFDTAGFNRATLRARR